MIYLFWGGGARRHCAAKGNLDGLHRICYYMDISLHCIAPLEGADHGGTN